MLNALNIRVKDLFESKVIRFLGIGAVNTAFGYFIYALFVFSGLMPEISLLMATVIGVLFNFFTFSRLVFFSKDNKKIVKFFILYGLIYAINSTSLRFLANMQVDPYTSQMIMVPLMAMLAFFGQRNFIFRKDFLPGEQDKEKTS